MILGLIAATDTSRNTVITTLSHLSKNKAAKEKLRAEIDSTLTKRDISDILKQGTADIKQDEFVYLNMLINEAMRFQNSATFTDMYVVQKNCRAGGINFLKDQTVMFSPYFSHYNPHQWQKPE